MNKNLGNYDMVLSLSTKRINGQFKHMQRIGKIHKDWAFLADTTDSRKIKFVSGEEANTLWRNAETAQAQLRAKQSELATVSQQLSKAIDDGDFEKAGSLNKRKKALEAEIKTIEETLEEAGQYNLGLVAQIAPPRISIPGRSHSSHTELIFQISFNKNSKVFYIEDGKRKEYDLGKDNCKYAFRTAINSIKITENEKIAEIDEHGNVTQKTLRDKGITDNDFTMESIFLDFGNAKIANFDEALSKLPDGVKANNALILALTNYFKGIGKDGNPNPYILGYGIKKKKIKETEKGFFYPTGVTYSSTWSNESAKSTLNFLMLTNGRSFPTDPNSGNLPKSLMTDVLSMNPPTDGVFGLDLKNFEKVYIPKLSEAIAQEIGGVVINGSLIQSDISNEIENGSMWLAYDRIYRKGTTTIVIVYKVAASGLAHQEIETLRGTVGVDWHISTEGSHHSTNGSRGSLEIRLKAGAKGSLELEPSYAGLKFGISEEKPNYKDSNDEWWNNFSKAIVTLLPELDRKGSNIGRSLSDFTTFDKVGDILNINNLQNIEQKVILPVSNVYAYKNVRLLNSSSQDNVLLFDATYAVVSE